MNRWPPDHEIAAGALRVLRRSMSGRALCLAVVALLALAPVARAEEATPPVPASVLLNLLNLPEDSPDMAFRESLKVLPPSRPAPEWVILPDGSARYGTARVSVVVSPPCPVGAPRPVALPGRLPR